jgi:hypothetical protein
VQGEAPARWKVRKPDGTVSAKQAAAGIMKRFLAAATRSGNERRRHAQWHERAKKLDKH